MLKVLAAIDGSAHSERVADYLIAQFKKAGLVEIHLLNVQIAIDSAHARMFVSAEDLDAYYREEGEKALQPARARLDAAGVPHHWHVTVGHAAETIARYAAERQFDQIVIGTHGRTTLGRVLMGSVASEVLRRAPVPVTMVR